MKKVLLMSVLLGSLMVGCSQETDRISFEESVKMQEEQIEYNQFSIICHSDKGCYFDYINHGDSVGYQLDSNERLYFNYPEQSRIVIDYRVSYADNTSINETLVKYGKVKIYSTKEIQSQDAIINENEIILQ